MSDFYTTSKTKDVSPTKSSLSLTSSSSSSTSANSSNNSTISMEPMASSRDGCKLFPPTNRTRTSVDRKGIVDNYIQLQSSKRRLDDWHSLVCTKIPIDSPCLDSPAMSIASKKRTFAELTAPRPLAESTPVSRQSDEESTTRKGTRAAVRKLPDRASKKRS